MKFYSLVDNKQFGFSGFSLFEESNLYLCENTEIGYCNEMREIHSSRYRLGELVPLIFFYSCLFFSTLV